MIFFKIFIKFILIFLLILGSYSFSSELIIPPKKPTLSDEVKKKIISKKNIIPPIKPTVKKEKEIQEEKKEKVVKAETDKDFQNFFTSWAPQLPVGSVRRPTVPDRRALTRRIMWG